MSRFAPKLIPQATARAIVQSKVDWIVSVCSPAQVYVFGSAARSEMTDHSDIDLALVFENEIDLKSAREVVYCRQPEDNWPQDVLLFTAEEFERKKLIGGVCFIIATEGVCMFERSKV